QVLADPHAGRARRDGAKRAANAVRGVRFQIEGFMLRRTAPEKELDNALEMGFSVGGIGAQQFREGQSGQCERAGAEELSPTESVAQTKFATAQVQHKYALPIRTRLGGHPLADGPALVETNRPSIRRVRLQIERDAELGVNGGGDVLSEVFVV